MVCWEFGGRQDGTSEGHRHSSEDHRLPTALPGRAGQLPLPKQDQIHSKRRCAPCSPPVRSASLWQAIQFNEITHHQTNQQLLPLGHTYAKQKITPVQYIDNHMNDHHYLWTFLIMLTFLDLLLFRYIWAEGVAVWEGGEGVGHLNVP